MKFKKYIRILLPFILFNLTNAQTLIINDFDSYADTAALRDQWSSFGGAASDGAPSLSEGTGVNNSNSAIFALGWNAPSASFAGAVYGSFPDKIFTLPPELQNLINYTEMNFSARLSDNLDLGQNNLSSTSTTVKIQFQGGTGENTVWESINEINLDTGNSYVPYSFLLSDSEMTRIDGSGSFEDTIQNVESINLLFQNTTSDSTEFVFFDNVTAVPEPSSFAMLAGLCGLGFTLYRRHKKVES